MDYSDRIRALQQTTIARAIVKDAPLTTITTSTPSSVRGTWENTYTSSCIPYTSIPTSVGIPTTSLVPYLGYLSYNGVVYRNMYNNSLPTPPTFPAQWNVVPMNATLVYSGGTPFVQWASIQGRGIPANTYIIQVVNGVATLNNTPTQILSGPQEYTMTVNYAPPLTITLAATTGNVGNFKSYEQKYNFQGGLPYVNTFLAEQTRVNAEIQAVADLENATIASGITQGTLTAIQTYSSISRDQMTTALQQYILAQKYSEDAYKNSVIANTRRAYDARIAAARQESLAYSAYQKILTISQTEGQTILDAANANDDSVDALTNYSITTDVSPEIAQKAARAAADAAIFAANAASYSVDASGRPIFTTAVTQAAITRAQLAAANAGYYAQLTATKAAEQLQAITDASNAFVDASNSAFTLSQITGPNGSLAMIQQLYQSAVSSAVDASNNAFDVCGNIISNVAVAASIRAQFYADQAYITYTQAVAIVTAAQSAASAAAYSAIAADVSGNLVANITTSQDDTTVAEAYELYLDASGYAIDAKNQDATAKTPFSNGAFTQAQAAANRAYASYQTAVAKRAAQLQAITAAATASTAATNAAAAFTFAQKTVAWQQADAAALDASGQAGIANTTPALQAFINAMNSRHTAYMIYLAARSTENAITADAADAAARAAASIYDLVAVRTAYLSAAAAATDAAVCAVENPTTQTQSAAAAAASDAASALASYTLVINYYEAQVIRDASDAIIDAADALQFASNTTLGDFTDVSGAYSEYLDASSNAVSAQQLAASLGTAVSAQAASRAAAAATTAYQAYQQASRTARGI